MFTRDYSDHKNGYQKYFNLCQARNFRFGPLRHRISPLVPILMLILSSERLPFARAQSQVISRDKLDSVSPSKVIFVKKCNICYMVYDFYSQNTASTYTSLVNRSRELLSVATGPARGGLDAAALPRTEMRPVSNISTL